MMTLKIIIVNYMSTHIDVFIKIIKTEDTSPSSLWETFKAYTRGHRISYASHERRMRKKNGRSNVSDLTTLLLLPQMHINRLTSITSRVQ